MNDEIIKLLTTALVGQMVDNKKIQPKEIKIVTSEIDSDSLTEFEKNINEALAANWTLDRITWLTDAPTPLAVACFWRL